MATDLASAAWAAGAALGVNGMVRQQLRVFADEGVVLTEELISARVTRELSSPFDIFTTFDLCAEALSGLATGQALGLAGPPAFAHDPFDRIILLGRARPFRLFGATEVRLFAAPGEGVHGVRIRVRRILSGDFLVMQKGGALRAVEAVTAQLQAGLARRKAALDAVLREQAAERAALQAKLSALQAQVEPHFLFNTLANLKYLMRTEPAAALTMLDHLTDYLHSALPDLRAVSSTVGRELDLAQAYLSIMQIRMGERLRFAIEASDAVRALPMPPAMLISLLENAVKHGLEGWPHPGTVRIEACWKTGCWRCACRTTAPVLAAARRKALAWGCRISTQGWPCCMAAQPAWKCWKARRAASALACTCHWPCQQQGRAHDGARRDRRRRTAAARRIARPVAVAMAAAATGGRSGRWGLRPGADRRAAARYQFLDIQIPGLNGLELAPHLPGHCQLVFVTAHAQHALAAFDAGAIDYLLKPLSTGRLLRTIRRLQERGPSAVRPTADVLRQVLAPPPASLKWIKASTGNTVRLMLVDEIDYFQADGKYTRVVGRNGEGLIRLSLKELLAQLDAAQFAQVHRSSIVNLHAVSASTGMAWDAVVPQGGTRQLACQ